MIINGKWLRFEQHPRVRQMLATITRRSLITHNTLVAHEDAARKELLDSGVPYELAARVARLHLVETFHLARRVTDADGCAVCAGWLHCDECRADTLAAQQLMELVAREEASRED